MMRKKKKIKLNKIGDSFKITPTLLSEKQTSVFGINLPDLRINFSPQVLDEFIKKWAELLRFQDPN